MHFGIDEGDDNADGNKKTEQRETERRPRIKGVASHGKCGCDKQPGNLHHDGARASEDILDEAEVGEADEFFAVAYERVFRQRRRAGKRVIGVLLTGIEYY